MNNLDLKFIFQLSWLKKNQKVHNPDSQLLISDVKNGEVVKEIVDPSYIDRQTRLI